MIDCPHSRQRLLHNAEKHLSTNAWAVANIVFLHHLSMAVPSRGIPPMSQPMTVTYLCPGMLPRRMRPAQTVVSPIIYLLFICYFTVISVDVPQKPGYNPQLPYSSPIELIKFCRRIASDDRE